MRKSFHFKNSFWREQIRKLPWYIKLQGKRKNCKRFLRESVTCCIDHVLSFDRSVRCLNVPPAIRSVVEPSDWSRHVYLGPIHPRSYTKGLCHGIWINVAILWKAPLAWLIWRVSFSSFLKYAFFLKICILLMVTYFTSSLIYLRVPSFTLQSLFLKVVSNSGVQLKICLCMHQLHASWRINAYGEV